MARRGEARPGKAGAVRQAWFGPDVRAESGVAEYGSAIMGTAWEAGPVEYDMAGSGVVR